MSINNMPVLNSCIMLAKRKLKIQAWLNNIYAESIILGPGNNNYMAKNIFLPNTYVPIFVYNSSIRVIYKKAFYFRSYECWNGQKGKF